MDLKKSQDNKQGAPSGRPYQGESLMLWISERVFFPDFLEVVQGLAYVCGTQGSTYKLNCIVVIKERNERKLIRGNLWDFTVIVNTHKISPGTKDN